MHDADTPVASRGFSSVDARRACLFFIILAFLVGSYWIILPGIQSLIIPKPPGGAAGPWVIRPILAFHAGAAAVMASVSVPLVMRLFQENWKRDDAAMGTRYDPYRNRPVARVGIMAKGFLLLLIYGCSLAFYLLSWTIIGTELRSDFRGRRENIHSQTSSHSKQFRTASGVTQLRRTAPGTRSRFSAAAASR